MPHEKTKTQFCHLTHLSVMQVSTRARTRDPSVNNFPETTKVWKWDLSGRVDCWPRVTHSARPVVRLFAPDWLNRLPIICTWAWTTPADLYYPHEHWGIDEVPVRAWRSRLSCCCSRSWVSAGRLTPDPRVGTPHPSGAGLWRSPQPAGWVRLMGKKVVPYFFFLICKMRNLLKGKMFSVLKKRGRKSFSLIRFKCGLANQDR